MNTSSLTPVNIDIDIDEPSNEQDELVQKLNKSIAGTLATAPIISV